MNSKKAFVYRLVNELSGLFLDGKGEVENDKRSR